MAAIEAWPVPKSSRSIRQPSAASAAMLRVIMSSGRSADHGFEDFDRQPLGRQVEAVELPADLVDQAWGCATRRRRS